MRSQATHLLLDYAAGAMPAARALLVETHLAMRPDAARAAALAEIAAGDLLERLSPAPVSPPRMALADRSLTPSPGVDEARRMIAAVRRDSRDMPWRRLPFRVWECVLPVPGLSLLRLAGGRGLPRHGHHGEELTLVLNGTFEDEFGRYGDGDIAIADDGVDHRPRVPPGPECVCLIARQGPMRFHGLLGLVANHWPQP